MSLPDRTPAVEPQELRKGNHLTTEQKNRALAFLLQGTDNVPDILDRLKSETNTQTPDEPHPTTE